MRFEQLYSSSKGNLFMLTADNGKRLMIECGVPWKKILQALEFDLKGIEGIILSHDHGDHSKAIRNAMKAGLTVYSGAGTFEALGIHSHHRARHVSNKTLVRFDSFEVLAFDVTHDANEPLGFCIRDKQANKYMLFATDTSHIRQKFNVPFEIIAIECSFDAEVLQYNVDNDKINEALATRLLTSHMEVNETKRYLRESCDMSQCLELHLLHLSASNIHAENIAEEFEREFLTKTIICEA